MKLNNLINKSMYFFSTLLTYFLVFLGILFLVFFIFNGFELFSLIITLMCSLVIFLLEKYKQQLKTNNSLNTTDNTNKINLELIDESKEEAVKTKQEDRFNNFSLFNGKYKKLYETLQTNHISLMEEKDSLIERLTNDLDDYKRYASDDLNLKKELEEKIELAKKDIAISKEQLENLKSKITLKETELNSLITDANKKKSEVASLNDDLFFAEFGLYSPVYQFANSEMYHDKLVITRTKQKTMIKNDIAVTYPSNFTLNNDLKSGKSMIKDNVKQILRSFNNEADVLIDKVKFNNVEAIRNRIVKSYESLNKLNERLNIAITFEYLSSKLEELNLSYEYALKKQEEKEQQKEDRERLREEAKLQKEIEESRKKLNKEKIHYENALNSINKKLVTEPDNPVLLSKQKELLKQLDEIQKGIENIDYREANKRAGYVYIISNIGSFGEDVYKIGMTRRLEPMDRINELGDASVPFNFDVHAMIFSDDAPSLENALHKAFEDSKVNMINTRREFFHAKLEDIEKVVRENYDKAVEFTKTPDAQQYRETLKMREL